MVLALQPKCIDVYEPLKLLALEEVYLFDNKCRARDHFFDPKHLRYGLYKGGLACTQISGERDNGGALLSWSE